MRRAERLFQIVQLVRGRRLTTAAFLAERLEISERSVYRDIAHLQQQGVPIEGEAGVGYRFGAGFELPPLMFTLEEAKALVASVRMAQPWQDVRLAQAGELALGKILSVLSPAAKAAALGVAVFAPPVGLAAPEQENLQLLREATQAMQKVRMHYQDAQESTSVRVIWPLGCFYWGKVWTLVAWCETRADFRNFRLDRITSITLAYDSADGAFFAGAKPAQFRAEPGKTLAAFLRKVNIEHER